MLVVCRWPHRMIDTDETGPRRTLLLRFNRRKRTYKRGDKKKKKKSKKMSWLLPIPLCYYVYCIISYCLRRRDLRFVRYHCRSVVDRHDDGHLPRLVLLFENRTPHLYPSVSITHHHPSFHRSVSPVVSMRRSFHYNDSCLTETTKKKEQLMNALWHLQMNRPRYFAKVFTFTSAGLFTSVRIDTVTGLDV